MDNKKNSVYTRWTFFASFTVATILPVNAQVTGAQLNELPDPAKPGGAQPRITLVELPASLGACGDTRTVGGREDPDALDQNL